MTKDSNNKIFDSAIIGGGPAGLSAAIYLARFNRSVIVFDCENGGRWCTNEINENYLGFPKGIAAKDLRELGKQQAKRFGAQFVAGTVSAITKEKGYFTITTDKPTYKAKMVILANGVTDHFPQFEHSEDYLGKSLFWGIVCDGYKTINKHVMVVGYTTESMTTALQFLSFTKHITFITNHEPGTVRLDPALQKQLEKHDIPIYDGKIICINGEGGFIKSVELSSSETVTVDYLFSIQEASPNTSLAKSLDVEIDENGYILTDHEQRTTIPHVYAAGDITKTFAHQIVTAAHEGATAAQAVNYDLYESFQQE